MNLNKPFIRDSDRRASAGAIGVAELNRDVNVEKAIKFFVSKNVWIRPFKNLIYLMPPYIVNKQEITQLTSSLIEAIKNNEV